MSNRVRECLIVNDASGEGFVDTIHGRYNIGNADGVRREISRRVLENLDKINLSMGMREQHTFSADTKP